MNIPTTLKHKPVITLRDYDKIDGRFAGNSDAKGLSLGLAQWNDRGRVDASAKVWRFTGDRWSRQSEELPLHRVVDLAILLCRSISFFRESYRSSTVADKENPLIERIGLQGAAASLEVSVDNPMIEEDIELFQQAMARDDELLSERLHRLANLLNEMGYGYGKAR